MTVRDKVIASTIAELMEVGWTHEMAERTATQAYDVSKDIRLIGLAQSIDPMAMLIALTYNLSAVAACMRIPRDAYATMVLNAFEASVSELSKQPAR